MAKINVYTISRHLAVFPMVIGCFSLLPLSIAYKPEITLDVVWATIISVLILLAMPIWIKWKPIRNKLYFPDAMSPTQREYICQGKQLMALEEAEENGFLCRFKPYLYKLMLISLSLLIVSMCAEFVSGLPVWIDFLVLILSLSVGFFGLITALLLTPSKVMKALLQRFGDR